ncbi:MAG: BREX-1 system adenine-specific DNA-methyltransferase PglX [Actinomycetota bacterium]|nr:BREX-1 system adenine-specific DNA-methyltransferase PglX [Actinomycetota bacterium]
MPLSKEARDAVARAVQRLRALFEEEFTRQATGVFGLHRERRAASDSVADERASDDADALVRPWVEPLSALSLTPTQVVQRSELVGAVAYLRREGCEGGEAVARLIREAAFTATNQLLAVRVAEAIGVLPEVTAQGRLSSGYREVVRDLFPLLAQQDDEGVWDYIQVCGDELGVTVPLLFDRRLPTSAFVPSRTCVDSAIAITNSADVAALWAEPEALGWAYQFFNRDDERQQMRAESGAPRDSRELAVRNQFFTPRYVVDWLVQNTLGRRLREAGYDLDLPLLVGEVGVGEPLALEDVRVLDPAVGSGHFLLGCYDLLEQAWQIQGVPPAQSASNLLRSLHGIEIDPRASQVAQAVLVLRARRAVRDGDVQPPAIATARPLPAGFDVRREVFERLSQNARDLAQELNDALEQASTLGSLLKVEERLDTALQRALNAPKLDQQVSAEGLEQELIDAVEEIARRADATPGARLFAADARDALRFVQLCQQRYDVVLMNPPFGDPIHETNDYIKSAYRTSAVNLYAAFVDRGVELLKEDGHLGAITSRTGFFLTTYQDWRSKIVVPRTLALIDLGLGVMHDAMVEAAAYVLSARPHHHEANFRRLLDEPDKASAVYGGTGDQFVRRPDDFVHVPGSSAAYWLSPRLLRVFRDHPTLKEAGIDVRQGIATADDFRFVRLWWEVSADSIGRRRRWMPFAKGGEYSPYYADVRLVLDWEDNGRRIREFKRAKGESESRTIRSQSHYFRPGLTWSLRSQKGFSVRPAPSGGLFGHSGNMIFVASDHSRDLDGLMGYLNSGMGAALLEAMVAFGKYEVGTVQRLPHLDSVQEAGPRASELTRLRMSEGERAETDHLFVSPWVGVGGAETAVTISRHVDEVVSRAVGHHEVVEPLSATYPTRWFEEDYDPPGSPTAHQELSYLLGVTLGRWDIRVALGTLTPPPLPGPYDPLPPVSRGMLVGEDGLPAPHAPEGYPLDLPTERLLHDEPGHPRDVVAAIQLVIGLLESAAAPPELALPKELRDLRGRLRGRFFADHVKDYSASRRYAPIYWYLAVPSREWGLWVYAPALSREILFAIAGAARDKLRRLRGQAYQLRQRYGDSADRAAIERIEQVDSLAAEVEQFAEHADKVAHSGWQPDLNDGLILCTAPLEPLFADEGWRRRVAEYRRNLEKNSYPWATVQREFYGGGQ